MPLGEGVEESAVDSCPGGACSSTVAFAWPPPAVIVRVVSLTVTSVVAEIASSVEVSVMLALPREMKPFVSSSPSLDFRASPPAYTVSVQDSTTR